VAANGGDRRPLLEKCQHAAIADIAAVKNVLWFERVEPLSEIRMRHSMRVGNRDDPRCFDRFLLVEVFQPCSISDAPSGRCHRSDDPAAMALGVMPRAAAASRAI